MHLVHCCFGGECHCVIGVSTMYVSKAKTICSPCFHNDIICRGLIIFIQIIVPFIHSATCIYLHEILTPWSVHFTYRVQWLFWQQLYYYNIQGEVNISTITNEPQSSCDCDNIAM